MLLVAPEKISVVMRLEPLPRSSAELERLIANGLPPQALKACVEQVCPYF